MADTWSADVQKLLRRLNSFHQPDSSKSKSKFFFIDDQQIGWIREDAAIQLRHYSDIFIEDADRFSLATKYDTYEKRSEVFARILNEMRSKDCWRSLRGWRDELYLVRAAYNAPALCEIERAGIPLFGIRSYGSHVNGYVIDDEGTWRMWIGKRSIHKPTFPGMFDNIAAGGLGHDLTPTECIIKECDEEAQIPKELITEKLRSVGAISQIDRLVFRCNLSRLSARIILKDLFFLYKEYFYGHCNFSYFYEDDDGLHPEGEFLYDLQLPMTFIPRAGDQEMEGFYLWTMNQVKEAIIKDDFKPNCAVAALDFLIRHGFITPDQESTYFDILSQIHMPGL